MFSKSKINEPAPGAKTNTTADSSASKGSTQSVSTPATPAKPKPPASVLSSDLHITGNLKTTGDIQVEGKVDGDIHAHLLTVGETAVISGEVIADDVIVHGRVVGCVRGLKVRLTSTAQVQGDIIHKTIAIESGAHFEGSVKRQDDPLAAKVKTAPKPAAKPAAAS